MNRFIKEPIENPIKVKAGRKKKYERVEGKTKSEISKTYYKKKTEKQKKEKLEKKTKIKDNIERLNNELQEVRISNVVEKKELIDGITNQLKKDSLNLTEEQKRELSSRSRELKVLLEMIEKRKKTYWVVDFKFFKTLENGEVRYTWKQKELFESVRNNEVQYYLYQGWNGAGKSAIWAYLTVLIAIWENCKKYNLPYIGSAKKIWIGTKSWKNVQSVIDPYLLGEGSITRIPPDEILKVHKDNNILKTIFLKNWTEISIYTYDQGAEVWQGGNVDWIWLDEEPRDNDILKETLARTRVMGSKLLVTMTPLAWFTPIMELFDEDGVFAQYTRKFLVSSLDNPFTDHTWAKGLTQEEYLSRVEGLAINPTWLVYNEFSMKRNIVPHIDPKDIEGISYRSIDFGTSHPTAVVFVKVDNDGNIYVWDEVYKSNTYLDDIADEIKSKSLWVEFKATYWDAAGKRERLELWRILWETITPADKHTKWENEMSNRRAWILLVNNLLHNQKLFISERCKNLIKEFSCHYYKEGGKKDWEVDKVNDDLLDALRYLIFNISKTKTKTTKQKQFEKKYWELITNKPISFL